MEQPFLPHHSTSIWTPSRFGTNCCTGGKNGSILILPCHSHTKMTKQAESVGTNNCTILRFAIRYKLNILVLTRFVGKILSLRPYYPIACASTCGRNATEAKEWDFDVDHPGIIFVSIRQGQSHVEYLYGLKAAKAADLKIRETEQSTTAVISGYTKQ